MPACSAHSVVNNTTNEHHVANRFEVMLNEFFEYIFDICYEFGFRVKNKNCRVPSTVRFSSFKSSL